MPEFTAAIFLNNYSGLKRYDINYRQDIFELTIDRSYTLDIFRYSSGRASGSCAFGSGVNGWSRWAFAGYLVELGVRVQDLLSTRVISGFERVIFLPKDFSQAGIFVIGAEGGEM